MKQDGEVPNTLILFHNHFTLSRLAKVENLPKSLLTNASWNSSTLLHNRHSEKVQHTTEVPKSLWDHVITKSTTQVIDIYFTILQNL